MKFISHSPTILCNSTQVITDLKNKLPELTIESTSAYLNVAWRYSEKSDYIHDILILNLNDDHISDGWKYFLIGLVTDVPVILVSYDTAHPLWTSSTGAIAIRVINKITICDLRLFEENDIRNVISRTHEESPRYRLTSVEKQTIISYLNHTDENAYHS